MSKNWKNVGNSKVEFSLQIEEKDLSTAQKEVVAQFQKFVSVQGFRKGHAPESVVREQIGEQRIFIETVNNAIDHQYRHFIHENQLRPIAAPEVQISDVKKIPIQVKVSIEIFPEVQLEDYKKIKLDPVQVTVKDEEVMAVIENILQEMRLQNVVDRPARKDDLVEVDFSAKDEEGKEIPQTKAENLALRLGKKNFLEDLEKGMVGMKAGEEKVISVKFPSNYPAAKLAGKKVPFTVKIRTVGELVARNLSEETIERMTGKKQSETELRQEIRSVVEGRKKEEERQKRRLEYQDKLLKYVKIDLPRSWIMQEVESRVAELKESSQFQHDPEAFWKHIGKSEQDVRKEFEKMSGRNLTLFLALSEIIRKENVELDKDEEERIEHSVQHKKAQAKGAFDEHSEVDRMRLSRKIDKYLDGLII